jgi:hypothetical protein
MAQSLHSRGCASDQRRMTLKIWRSMLAWFGRAPTLPYQTLDTAWAEPPAQRANRKGQQ